MTRPRTILVTGGAGFIGSHTCKQLSASGYLPIAFDNLSRGHSKAVRWGPLVVGDIRDPVALDRAISDYRPEAIIHFAALAYVGVSVAEPAAYYSNNVAGTHVVLEAARKAAIRRLVFSSSCATYGVPDTLPVAEAAPQRPISPYGRTKLIGEQMIEDYGRAYGLSHVILRYFNACGADPDGEIGEWHTPETHIVPRILMAASGAIPAVEIFGTDYATPDGTCIRDYIHVTDLARAHGLALDYLAHSRRSLAVNVGTGRGISVQEILNAVARSTGRSVPIQIRPRRPGDPAILYADPSLAGRALGFSTEFSDIETILATTAISLSNRRNQPQPRQHRRVRAAGPPFANPLRSAPSHEAN